MRYACPRAPSPSRSLLFDTLAAIAVAEMATALRLVRKLKTLCYAVELPAAA